MAKQIVLVILFVALAFAEKDSVADSGKNSTKTAGPVCSVGLCCFNNEFKYTAARPLFTAHGASPFRSKNVLCGYSTSECLADSFCTGDSAECPPLTKKVFLLMILCKIFRLKKNIDKYSSLFCLTLLFLS